MTAALLRPYALPAERVRPGTGLLVVVAHVGLLWVANLYWPLQNVLLGAVQSVTVQIFQADVKRSTAAAADADNALLETSPQAISDGRQRAGRAAMTLELPASQTQQSTPLAGTAQTAQTAPVKPVPVASRPPEPSQPQVQSDIQALPKAAVLAAPQPVPVERPVEVKLPELATPQLSPATTPTPPSPSPPVPTLPSVPIATPPAVVAAPAPAPSASSPAIAVVNTPQATPGATAAPGTGAPASGNAGQGAGPAASSGNAAQSQGLNLNLPPRYIYRPPMALPRRSLSELANDQLRRKPRDPFADAVNGAGNIDCLKDTPEGPVQGLLAVGPLLKRAIEEKCKK